MYLVPVFPHSRQESIAVSSVIVMRMVTVNWSGSLLIKLLLLMKWTSSVLTQTVKLESKRLTSFPTPDVPAETQYLNLKYNQITTIEAGAMDHLQSLLTLNLQNNQIQILGDVAAVGATLNKLVLSNNPMKVIPAGTFDGLDVLTELYLSSCELEVMPDLQAVGDTLTTLYLRNNPLMGNPPDDLMAKLITVKYLFLGDNNFTKMPNLSSMKESLHTIQLTGNPIEHVSREVMSSLTALRIIYIDYIGSCLVNITSPNLKSILFYDRSDAGSYDFYTLDNLITIEFNDNHDFVSYPSINGDLTALTTLALKNLRVREFPSHLIQQTPTVTQIVMKELNPSTDPKPFHFPGNRDDVVSVSTLDVQNCYLTTFPDLNYLKNSLKILNMNNNKLSAISYNNLEDATNLTQIILSRNQLSALPYFEKLHLSSLVLDYNDFTSIPEAARSVSSGSLTLIQNDIKNITDQESILLSSVVSLDVRQNFNLDYMVDFCGSNCAGVTVHIYSTQTQANLCSCRNAWLLERRIEGRLKYTDVTCFEDGTKFSQLGMDKFLLNCTGPMLGKFIDFLYNHIIHNLCKTLINICILSNYIHHLKHQTKLFKTLDYVSSTW